MQNNITTEAIAELVRSHGTIAALDVGKHFGQPHWTGLIESTAKPLIESGQITISADQGVVWVESPEPKRIQTQQSDSDIQKGIPLPAPKESLTGQMSDVLPPCDRENEQKAQNINIGCLLMPLRGGIPVFRTRQDKANFDENRLTRWEHHPDATAPDIMRYADAGRVFVPGHFTKCAEKNRYRHTKATWQRTQMIATDADQIKSVDFDNKGKDTTPDGVEAFTDPNSLLELNPTLTSEAYAIGHSLSSLSKPPPHIRCRIYFVLAREIRTETDFKWMLLGLSTIYPIVSASRQPAQPVYGNAGKRRIFKEGAVQETDQPFRTRIFDNVLSAERVQEIIETGKQTELEQAADAEAERHRKNTMASPQSIPTEYQTTLIEWLKKHNIPIRGERASTYLFVDCPWEDLHTSDFGAKDTAVWEDKDFGFCFHCLHNHCEGRSWSDYRQAVAPKETYMPQKQRTATTTQRYLRRERYGYDRF